MFFAWKKAYIISFRFHELKLRKILYSFYDKDLTRYLNTTRFQRYETKTVWNIIIFKTLQTVNTFSRGTEYNILCIHNVHTHTHTHTYIIHTHTHTCTRSRRAWCVRNAYYTPGRGNWGGSPLDSTRKKWCRRSRNHFRRDIFHRISLKVDPKILSRREFGRAGLSTRRRLRLPAEGMETGTGLFGNC